MEKYSPNGFQLVLNFGHAEVTSRGKEVIIEDVVSCVEFGKIYDEFCAIVSQGDIITFLIFSVISSSF